MNPVFIPLHGRYRYRSVPRALGLIFLGCFLLLSGTLSAQEYYYYYKGKRQSLELNTAFVYVVTSSQLGDSQRLSAVLEGSGTVSRVALDDSPNTLKRVSTASLPTEYWAEVKLNAPMTSQAYLSYLGSLKGKNGIQIVSPFFTDADGKKVGLSQYFYVKLKNAKDLDHLQKMAQETNTVIVGQNKFMPLWYTLKCTASSRLNAMQAANRFQESGVFQYAEPDLMVEDLVHHVPNDPFYGNQWGLRNTGQYTGTPGFDIRAEGAWDLTKGSREVIVAVLDHGFEMDHPDLAVNTFGTGFDTGSGTSPAQVHGEHGTACAGIVAASQDNNMGVSGVAPDARLMSVSNPLFLSPTVQQELADGINWAWQNGASVISNSWGHNSLASSLIDDAITDALALGRGGLGTIIVFASGNNNSAVIYPGNSNPDIVTVGAMSPCGERKSPTSCDTEALWGSNFGATLDVVAPGVLISTTDQQGGNGYNPTQPLHSWAGGSLVGGDFPDDSYTIWFNGTSSATPMVAGVAALILSVNPCLTHDQVEDIIEQTAQKVGGYGYAMTMGRPNGTWHNEMGYGLVDAEAAVQSALALLPALAGFDLISRDRPFDTGAEPNPDSGPMYITDDIWVRQNMDGAPGHQNPEYKVFSPNGVYVRITNIGSSASTCAVVSLYFSKASTGLIWPTHWHDYFQATSAGSILHGDKINTVLIPPIPAGGSYTVEIPWYPPNPADFDIDVHHFCLVSRIESPSDPMFSEGMMVGIGGNVRNNNNIVWKNVSVFNTNISDSPIGLFVRGTKRDRSLVNLRFLDRGFQEEVRVRFFERGGVVTLGGIDPKFMERLKQAKLTEIEMQDEKTLVIRSAKATIEQLQLYPKETFAFTVHFKVGLNEGEETLFDLVQQDAQTGIIEGGERFVIQAGKPGETIIKRVAPERSIAYPNPATAELHVNYNVTAENSSVSITIQPVNSLSPPVQLLQGDKTKGDYVDKFSVRNLPKGVYLLTLKVGDRTVTERVIIE